MEQVKVNLKLQKSDWERSLMDNINLIINNKMQIKMAEEVIELCKKEIAKFPETMVKPVKLGK